MRVVHYLNQFFGGLGGEELAGTPPQTHNAAVGPGRVLEQVLGREAQVVRTIVCGDNYAAENLAELTAFIIREAAEADAELFVTGPCFEAGRYGLAAGALCAAVSAELGIPVVTGMSLENPGVDLYRQEIYIVDSGPNASAMREVLEKMAGIALKLTHNQEIGLPAEEGYISRGILRDAFVEKSAAERLVEMLFAKTTGEPFESELPAPTFAATPAPPAVADMSKAKVAVVTDGGLVPRGNPDKISAYAATNWGSYDISGASDLQGEDYEISHRGYDTRYVEQDPDRLVPLDVLRELEQDRVVGEIHNKFIATSGLANPLANSRRLGREIAQNLKESGVDAVILTST
jgi:glycine reductase complex component B subunit gamma